MSMATITTAMVAGQLKQATPLFPKGRGLKTKQDSNYRQKQNKSYTDLLYKSVLQVNSHLRERTEKVHRH